ncbi:hypothetical protein EGW08_015869 [Elysia chlorotica]|uniref:Microsomal glutathione S-transferase 2 n=1 Tax=Elysia chlorotica TaxID=188477 RepID=A0A433T456_ELYCH|nr:hypothetical protein EGW08_015869 [Elysia chlorotica]
MSVVDQYALPGLVSVAGVHQILRFALKVGSARKEFKVAVPATTGPDGFVRVFRAHQNALEAYSPSLAALWVGAVFVHPVPASLLYGGYLIGRERSFWGYCEAADKRLPGLYFSYRCIMGLVILACAGVANSLVRHYLQVDLSRAITEKVTWLKL